MPLWCCYKFIARIRSVLPRMDFDIGIPAPKQWLIFLKELFGEFLGTFWIVFFGCGSAQAPALAENDVVQVRLYFPSIFLITSIVKVVLCRFVISM